MTELPDLIRAVLVRSALGEQEPIVTSRWERAKGLLFAQARLVPPFLWWVSALVMAAAVGLALAKNEAAELVLALVVPLVTVAGAAGMHDQRQAFELVAAAPTSPRVVLLARVTLVLGYDLALGLVASALPYGPGVLALMSVWLGPAALLAALGLLLSVWWHPEGAMGVSLALWLLYALGMVQTPGLDVVRWFWTSEAVTLVLAAASLAAAVISVGKGEPIVRRRATHWS